MNPVSRIAVWMTLAALGAGCVLESLRIRADAEQRFWTEAAFARDAALRIQASVVLFSERAVPSGFTFASALQSFGISSEAAARAAASLRPLFDVRRMRAGNRLAVGRSVLGDLRAIRYRIDDDRMLWIAPHGETFHAEIQRIPSVIETAGVAGTIRGSLFEGVASAGERPELALRLADIFGWDLDFYTDPRPGDTFRLVVEKKKYSDGETAAYGRILVAEYNNDGRIYRAVLFHDPFGHPAYYTPEGKSLRKAFLHSPLKFAAPITSHFSQRRFHPILKTYRPHLGIDYGAPVGTPVQAIGDGRVVFAGPKGGAGNLVEVQHTNGYETYYLHLSRLLVRPGQRVEQGQRIGLVGMTGLATGPHLDFRIERRGQFLNFERLPLPPAEPVACRDWNEFSAARDRSLGLLPISNTALAHNQLPPSPSFPAPPVAP